MKTEDLLVLGFAAVAVLMILKAGNATPQFLLPAKRRQSNTGLSYDPGPGYGDTSKYFTEAAKAVYNDPLGI